MRYLDIPALSIEDIEDPDIVEITEAISASISGTTLTIDGGNKVSGEATINLTGDVTVDTITKNNIRGPSIHKISIKTNGLGNFTYVPNTGVTASSVSTTTKTGSDFEILLITTAGDPPNTYIDLDLADYVSPAANFTNELTGFNVSELTSTYGASAKLYKPDGTLLTTLSSARSGRNIQFGYAETKPKEVEYQLEVKDDLGRTSTYNVPRKWIQYSMGITTTPGFQKLQLSGNEYITTTIIPNLSPTSTARVIRANDNGYIATNFKIQGRNVATDNWSDVGIADENDDVIAFGEYLYYRVWVKPTGKAVTTTTYSNIVTLTLTNLTESNLDVSFTGIDPYQIDETTNTYVFQEPTKIGKIPFTVHIGEETYTDAVTATTEEVASEPNTDMTAAGPNMKHTIVQSGAGQYMCQASADGRYIAHNPSSNSIIQVLKGDVESGYTNYTTFTYSQASSAVVGSMSYDGKYIIVAASASTSYTYEIWKNDESTSTFTKLAQSVSRIGSYNRVSKPSFVPRSGTYDFGITGTDNNNNFDIQLYKHNVGTDTWTGQTTINDPANRPTGDNTRGLFSCQFTRDGNYLMMGAYSTYGGYQMYTIDWDANTAVFSGANYNQNGNIGHSGTVTLDGKYVLIFHNDSNSRKIFKNNDAGDWSSATDVTSTFTFENTDNDQGHDISFFGEHSEYFVSKMLSGNVRVYSWYNKKEISLTFSNPTLTLTCQNITISSAKLYKDDVLFHTYGTENILVLLPEQSGTYYVVVNDVYYSNRVTPDFTTTRSVSAPQLNFDGYNKLHLSNITPTSTTLGLPDGTTRDLTTQSNVYIYKSGTYTANVQSTDTFAYLSNVVTSQPSQHPTDVGPTFTFDGFNRLSLSNITHTSSTLEYGSNTYDTNTASNVYVTYAGEYVLEAKDSNTFVTSNVYVGAVDTIPEFTAAFHHGAFSASDYSSAYSSVSDAATAGFVYSDTPAGEYTWGTLAHVKERENPDFTDDTTLHTDYSSTYGWTTNSGWEVSAKDEFSSTYEVWNAFNKGDGAANNNWLSNSSPSTSSPQWLKIKYPSQQVIKSYVIKSGVNATPYFPTAWKLQGANTDIGDTDTGWTDIGSEQTQTAWLLNQNKSFDLSTNTTAYQYYRLRITGSKESASSSNSDYVAIGEWYLNTLNGDNTTNHDQYTRYTYTPASSITAKVLMVAGGGGGGGGYGGGGGSGGLLLYENVTLSGAKSITVGNGGLGGIGYNNGATMYGITGINTSVSGLTTVIGGGGGVSGGGANDSGKDGGSGGGGSRNSTGTGGTGTSGQGNNGGSSSTSAWGGGGGGAGGVGGNSSSNKGGDGGIGKDMTIYFDELYGDQGYFASGGGGGGRSVDLSAGPGTASQGGGSNGESTDIKASDAQKHTGGGGGGQGSESYSTIQLGGNGGSGIVLIKKLVPTNPPTLNFDGYNKLTIDNVDSIETVTIKKDGLAFGTTTSSTIYIKDTGIYTVEVKGSNAYVTEASTVVNTISEPAVSGTHRFPLDSGTLTDSNNGSVAFGSGATFEAPELRKDAKTSYKLSVGQNKNVTLPSALSNWCVSMWVFIPYVTSYGSSNSSNIPSDFSSYTHNFGYSWSYIWIWHMANGREFRHQTHHDSHIYEYSSASATSAESINMYHSWGSSIGSSSKQNWHPGNNSNNAFMPEAWHHMAWEYNGTTGKFKWYCDGIERTTAEVTMTTGCSLNGMTFGDSTPNGSIGTDGGTSSGNPYWYISDLVIAPSWNVYTYNLTKGTYKHFLPIPNTLGVLQLRGEGTETSVSSPSLTFDTYNKLTINNVIPISSSLQFGSNIYNIGTANTVYVKHTGDYVFKISGTDKYAESNVYVSSLDLVGAPIKPIDFDGFNKLTLMSPGANPSANVTLGDTKYELGTANVMYINGAGTYDLELSGSNVFALASTVVNSVNTIGTRYYAFTFEDKGQYVDVRSIAIYDSSSSIVLCQTKAQLDDPTNKFSHDDTLKGLINFGIITKSYSLIRASFSSDGYNGTRGPHTISFQQNEYNFHRTNVAIPIINENDRLSVFMTSSYVRNTPSQNITYTNDIKVIIWEGETQFIPTSNISLNNYTNSTLGIQTMKDELSAWGTRVFTVDLSTDTTYTNVSELAHRDNGNGTIIIQGKYFYKPLPAKTSSSSPFLTFNKFNKLTITDITPTSTTLKYGSNIYDIGAASNIYIENTGRYDIVSSNIDTFVLTSVSVGTPSQHPTDVVPSLTYDNTNKLTIADITPTSTTLKYGSNTYDIGTATDIYINEAGTYQVATGDATTFALVSNVVSSTPSGTYNRTVTTGTEYIITTDQLFLNYEAWNYSGSGNWLNQVNTTLNPGVFPSSITYNSVAPKSFVFNNSGDERINAGNVNLQQVWSLECWAKFYDFTATRGLFGHGIAGNNTGLHIHSNATSLRIGFYLNDVDATYTFQTDTWYHMVFTYNNSGTSRQCYINGVLQSLTTFGTTYGSNYGTGTDELSIGNTYSPGVSGSPLKGEMSVARMYTKVLTAEEIGVNYAAGYLGTTFTQTSTTGNTPSQTYDTINKITVTDIPTDVAGKIYKGSSAYTIHATTSSSNVIIKNTGTYVSVFTTASTAYLTNTIDVTETPTDTGLDNTIEDSVPLVTVSGALTIVVFHYGTFADSSDPHGDGDVNTAATAGHIYSDTTPGTYTWGTLTSGTVNAPTGLDSGASRGNHTPGNTTYKWIPPGTITGARMLLVGGGGGAGMNMGGGGGAGGFLALASKDIPASEQTVVVGRGGIGAPGQNQTNILGQTQGSDNSSYNTPAYNGGDSSISSEIAYGGGTGGYSNNADARSIGGNGGSGGGVSGYNANPNNRQGGTGVSGQGNRGGNSNSTHYSGGGGGAGAAGVDATNLPHGGDGLPSDILGTEYWWSGGGGGAGYTIQGGNGGKGGGGGGAVGTKYGGTGGLTAGQNGGGGGTVSQTNTPGGDGGKHTGGGGGGGAHYQGNNKGGNGGSGIVIIKYVATTTTGGIAGSTPVTEAVVVDTPSAVLDVAAITTEDPILDLDFTTELPKTIKRYNTITSSSIGARFNYNETKKKRIEKSINTDTFSMELTANNASSPTTLTVTVANSKFVINGVETPTLAFIRGETYTFVQTDASNSGHPLVLVTSEDGATLYETGWVNSVFTVPYDVPDTIYYKCTNHAGMGGAIHTTFGNLVTFGNFTLAANTQVSGEYTIAANYDGTTSNLYVDGDLITQTTPTISAGTKDFILGKEYDGYIKNFTFWNYAKSFFVPIVFTNPNFTGEGVVNLFSGVTLEYVDTTGDYANYIWKTSSGNIVTDGGAKFNVVERKWYDVRTGDETDANNKPYQFEIRQGNANSGGASGVVSNPSGVCINGNLVIFRGIDPDNDWLNSIYMSGIV